MLVPRSARGEAAPHGARRGRASATIFSALAAAAAGLLLLLLLLPMVGKGRDSGGNSGGERACSGRKRKVEPVVAANPEADSVHAVNHVKREHEGRSAKQAELCKKRNLRDRSKGSSRAEPEGGAGTSTMGTAPPAHSAPAAVAAADPNHGMKKIHSYFTSLKPEL